MHSWRPLASASDAHLEIGRILFHAHIYIYMYLKKKINLILFIYHFPKKKKLIFLNKKIIKKEREKVNIWINKMDFEIYYLQIAVFIIFPLKSID